jgi:hypothetical protein
VRSAERFFNDYNGERFQQVEISYSSSRERQCITGMNCGGVPIGTRPVSTQTAGIRKKPRAGCPGRVFSWTGAT